MKNNGTIEERAKLILQHTLQIILPDIINGSGIDSVSRGEVIVCIIEHGYFEKYTSDDEALDWLKSKKYDDLVMFAKTVFTQKKYRL